MGLTDGPNILGHKITLDGLPQFVGDVGQARAALRGAREESVHTGTAVESVGASMVKTAAMIAAPIMGFQALSKALAEAAEGHKAMGQLRLVMKGSIAATEQFGEQIDDLAGKVGIADDELLQAAASALKFGVSQKDLFEFVKTSAQTSVVSYDDLGAVIRATTNILQNYNLGAEEASKVQNVLLQAVKMGAGSFEEIGSVIGMQAAAARSLGIGYEDLVGIMGVLGQSGVTGQRALMGLQTIMQSMLSPAENATKEARRLGIAWDVDSIRAKGFAGWIGDVREKLKEAASEGNDTAASLDALGMSARTGGPFNVLLNSAEKLAGVMTQIRDSGGEIEGIFATERNNDPFEQWKRIQAKSGQLWEAFGTGIAEGMTGSNGGDVVDKMGAMIPALQDFGRTFASAIKNLAVVAEKLLPIIEGTAGAAMGANNAVEDSTGISPLNVLLGGAFANWGVKKLAGKSAWDMATGNRSLWQVLSRQSASTGAATAAKAVASGGSTLAAGITPGMGQLLGENVVYDAANFAKNAIELPQVAQQVAQGGRWAKMMQALRGVQMGGWSAIGALNVGQMSYVVQDLIDAATATEGVATGYTGPGSLVDMERNRAALGERQQAYQQSQEFIRNSMDASLEEMLLGQTIPGLTDTIDAELRKFGAEMGDGLGTRLAALAGDLPGAFIESMRSRVEAAMAPRMLGPEKPSAEVLVRLDHTIHSNDYDSQGNLKKHSATAKVSGAGNAELHTDYRFMVLREGQGAQSVRPLEENVMFSHIRGGG